MARDPVGPISRTRTTPVPVQRSTRRLDIRNLTSLPAGRMVPIAAFGLLREDQVGMSTLRINFEMMETVELLVNAINVNVKAYLVPNLAFPRFNGIDQLNRSFGKIPETDGGTVVPYFQTVPFLHASGQIFRYLGKHARENQPVNNAYIEAYNLIWNFRAANRSPDITPRPLTDQSLAKAFWSHQRMAAVVPDFDQAAVDGEVPLSVTDGTVTLRGLYTGEGWNDVRGMVGFFRQHTPQTPINLQQAPSVNTVTTGSANTATATIINPYVVLPQIVGELQEQGITVSLSNIEMARQTQAFAMLRKQYGGIPDEYIIDLLMNGISVPEQQWRQPMLLADRSTIFGMSKRYASDSLDLTASVANGATFIDLPLVTPRVPTGGVVMVTAEISPEQLWERQMDPYMFVSDQDTLPEFLRDTLDPEKVEIVQCQGVDVDHDTPTATFGYAPLNWKWTTNPPGIGGKFYRPQVDASFDEDRQRIWAVETQNPTLSEDFYLCTNMHTKPFVVTNQDPFESVTRGLVTITGNTVFGRMLVEATDDYDKIMAGIPIDRIDKPAAMDGEAKPAEAEAAAAAGKE